MNEIIFGQGTDVGQGNNGRWFPAKGSWLESWQMKADDVGKNIFTSVENDNGAVPDSLFSRGMSDAAERDMMKRGGMKLNKNFFEKDEAAKYIDASMFGSKVAYRFGGGADVGRGWCRHQLC